MPGQNRAPTAHAGGAFFCASSGLTNCVDDAGRNERQKNTAVEKTMTVEEPRLPSHASDAAPNGPAAMATRWAPIGVFVILAGSVLYVGKSLFLPIVAALVLGIMCGRLAKKLEEHGIPPWLSALLIVIASFAGLSLTLTYLTVPVIEWVQQASQLTELLKAKLQFLERPLAALDEIRNTLSGQKGQPEVAIKTAQTEFVRPVIEFLSPTITGLLLFFSTFYLFLAGRQSLRQSFVVAFKDHDTRLRALRILNEIETNLGTYFAAITLINMGLGTLTAIGCWLIGLPTPISLGLLAFILNYIPIIGPAVTVTILLAIGLVAFDTLGHAALAPGLFIGIATLEGHFVTPYVIGRNLTLSAFTVLMSFAFWTWLWGPVGAFLASPLLIVGLVAQNHLRRSDDPNLPD
jgi:predicted PurR-regulated permease PerM